MKRILIISGLAVAALVAMAAAPTYTNKTASGTTSAECIFPAKAGLQFRLVSANVTSDNSTGALYYATCSTAFKVTVANASSSGVTQVVNTTVGVPASCNLILQKADGSCYRGILSSTNNGTNVVLTSGGFGAATVSGDQIFLMGASNVISVGNATVDKNGEALFVGNVGRPVSVKATGAAAVSINTAVGRYE